MAIVLLCDPFDLLITCSSVLRRASTNKEPRASRHPPIIPSADIERIYLWPSRTTRINNTRTTFKIRRLVLQKSGSGRGRPLSKRMKFRRIADARRIPWPSANNSSAAD
jgi:hypothetical protein